MEGGGSDTQRIPAKILPSLFSRFPFPIRPFRVLGVGGEGREEEDGWSFASDKVFFYFSCRFSLCSPNFSHAIIPLSRLNLEKNVDVTEQSFSRIIQMQMFPPVQSSLPFLAWSKNHVKKEEQMHTELCFFFSTCTSYTTLGQFFTEKAATEHLPAIAAFTSPFFVHEIFFFVVLRSALLRKREAQIY